MSKGSQRKELEEVILLSTHTRRTSCKVPFRGLVKVSLVHLVLLDHVSHVVETTTSRAVVDALTMMMSKSIWKVGQ